MKCSIQIRSNYILCGYLQCTYFHDEKCNLEQLSRTETALDETEEQLRKADIRLKNIKKARKLPCCFMPCLKCCQIDPEQKWLAAPSPGVIATVLNHTDFEFQSHNVLDMTH